MRKTALITGITGQEGSCTAVIFLEKILKLAKGNLNVW